MHLRRCLLAAIVAGAAVASHAADRGPSIAVWASSVDGTRRLTRQPDLEFDTSASANAVTIAVDPTQRFQTLLGLGSSLEPSTCWNLSRLDATQQVQTLSRLVSPTDGLGMNLMRICIGTPDFTGDPWYSYDDRPAGETDPELRHFSIDRDRAYILPILQLARKQNPELLFFASPWSPPGWMKTAGTLIGGQLRPECAEPYAEYFARFIEAYATAGVPIHAITIQNEPGVDRAREKDPKWHYPSCHWTGEQERDFIRDHLGPVFRRHHLTTQIWTYDHNYNVKASGDDAGIAYPRTVLSDPAAAAFVDGVGFHGYVGEAAGMSVLHREFPDVPLHFTEGSVFGVRGGLELIDRLRHSASSYNAWVTLLDRQGKPNNGPFAASRTIITLDLESHTVTENFDFFLYGQFMKFLPRGSVRIASSDAVRDCGNVAFETPAGDVVLVVVNAARQPQPVQVQWHGRIAAAELPAGSASTFRWPAR